MAIWNVEPTLQILGARSATTMVGHLGIEFLEVGPDYLVARMPVDRRTVQPAGILHGGASAVLAETLASVAGTFCVDLRKKRCVGLTINADHLRSVRGGWVVGTARPIRVGRTTQVWEVRIEREDGKLACISRVTLAVVDVERPSDR